MIQGLTMMLPQCSDDFAASGPHRASAALMSRLVRTSWSFLLSAVRERETADGSASTVKCMPRSFIKEEKEAWMDESSSSVQNVEQFRVSALFREEMS